MIYFIKHKNKSFYNYIKYIIYIIINISLLHYNNILFRYIFITLILNFIIKYVPNIGIIRFNILILNTICTYAIRLNPELNYPEKIRLYLNIINI